MGVPSLFSNRVARRELLQATTAAVLAAPTVITSSARGEPKTAATERVALGFVGMGVRSRSLLRHMLGFPEFQVVAISEVVRQRRDHGRQYVQRYYARSKTSGSYKGCHALNDFREVVGRDDVDAVVIGTPDHWHAIQAVTAAGAGKDIYCEKPMTLAIAQGRKMVRAVRENKVVFQTGSQQRSEYGGRFRLAVELVRNGRIGRVKKVHVGVGGPPIPCDLPEEPTPEGTDWEMWNGPAPKRGYNEILCPKGVHHHFPAFRRYREYAGGALADMGAHHFDIVQWALDMDHGGPVKIEPPEDGAKNGLKLTYASGITVLHGGPGGCTFEGTAGTIYVDRRRIKSDPASIIQQPIGPDGVRVHRADGHCRNWLDCIRSRKLPICDVEIGHRSATVCHLANIGYQLGRTLQWDPGREQLTDDDEANKLLDRELRAPWKL